MGQRLALTRKLIALDVETATKVMAAEDARICEIGFKIIYPDDREPTTYVNYINPGVPIDKQFTDEVHGISDADVANAMKFSQLAPNLAKGFKDCDYCGYNVRFDLRVLAGEMNRAGVPWSVGDAKMVDSMHLWRVGQPRTLSDAVREFLGREPTEAHRALGDASDALEVALAEIERFNMPLDVEKLHDLCFDSKAVDPEGKFIRVNNRIVCNFGKHKGIEISKMPRPYLKWMHDAGDFSFEVKALLREALA